MVSFNSYTLQSFCSFSLSVIHFVFLSSFLRREGFGASLRARAADAWPLRHRTGLARNTCLHCRQHRAGTLHILYIPIMRRHARGWPEHRSIGCVRSASMALVYSVARSLITQWHVICLGVVNCPRTPARPFPPSKQATARRYSIVCPFHCR